MGLSETFKESMTIQRRQLCRITCDIMSSNHSYKCNNFCTYILEKLGLLLLKAISPPGAMSVELCEAAD